MTLQSVKSFGTEGRRNGVNEIPPSPNTEYDHIKFKVDQLDDLKLIQAPTAQDLDPAIIASEKKAAQAKKETKPPPSSTKKEEEDRCDYKGVKKAAWPLKMKMTWIRMTYMLEKK